MGFFDGWGIPARCCDEWDGHGDRRGLTSIWYPARRARFIVWLLAVVGAPVAGAADSGDEINVVLLGDSF